MNIEESKILLKDFQKGKIEKDKLETYKGGYKLGYFYTVGIQEAIETVLSELEKKDKIIDLMAEKMNMTKTSPCINEFSIGKVYMSKEEVIEYFTNKAEREGK